MATSNAMIIAVYAAITVILDPGASTVGHLWIWENGGGYFGVPLTNYLGWYLTVFIFLLLFSLYRGRRPDTAVRLLTPGFWFQAPVLFAVMALDYPANYFGVANIPIADATGKTWQSGDIYETAAIASLYTMLAVAVAAFVVLLVRRSDKSVPHGSVSSAQNKPCRRIAGIAARTRLPRRYNCRLGGDRRPLRPTRRGFDRADVRDDRGGADLIRRRSTAAAGREPDRFRKAPAGGYSPD